ncbi:hypothetical protein FB566_4011 [Stackebrandtia endophytica]|uniref:Uncharacterized protein n=1 Tax=Stackebrandtia endophytica TaxID=1496996 RepID=A0A543B0Q9_9ACTN|nr:hypothetical protein [Stackebrandtia endophytica]TQL78425.1 hypothetical protein FB566_4011 [Stackebrandtia endophytica]
MSYPNPPQDEPDVHIDLDQPEPETDDRERRLNSRITGLLIVAVVLAVGLVTSTVLYAQQVDENNELRKQLAGAAEPSAGAESPESSTDAESPATDPTVVIEATPTTIPDNDDEVVVTAVPFSCEALGWYPLDDDARLDEAVEISLGDSVVHCLKEP